MKIEIATIEKIAHLARLELTEQEKSQMAGDFEQILDWMNQLNEVDTSNTEPLIHINPTENVFREDVESNELSTERALFNAPLKDENYFKVPKVME
jgi:aspartyl-tRNA(Asn)/glutamyl-tRNA(Gln) amidotransferase subunit C